MKTVLIFEDAVNDLEVAKEFYNKQEHGAGAYFINSILNDLDKLSENYGIHPKYFRFHRKLASKFPYAIYYSITDSEIRVAAILDLRRNPENIIEELSKR